MSGLEISHDSLLCNSVQRTSCADICQLRTLQENVLIFGNRQFIGMLTEAHHWTLYSVRWSQSASSETTNLKFTLKLSSHLCLTLRNMFFPSGSLTKILSTGLLCCVQTSVQQTASQENGKLLLWLRTVTVLNQQTGLGDKPLQSPHTNSYENQPQNRFGTQSVR
jgi:hypothetical protein